jgi:hypothetical protein
MVVVCSTVSGPQVHAEFLFRMQFIVETPDSGLSTTLSRVIAERLELNGLNGLNGLADYRRIRINRANLGVIQYSTSP